MHLEFASFNYWRSAVGAYCTYYCSPFQISEKCSITILVKGRAVGSTWFGWLGHPPLLVVEFPWRRSNLNFCWFSLVVVGSVNAFCWLSPYPPPYLLNQPYGLQYEQGPYFESKVSRDKNGGRGLPTRDHETHDVNIY